MQNMNRYIIQGFFYFILLSSRTVFADIDTALKAVDAGDYLTAYQVLKPLAEAGNAEAQHNLAMLYKQGKGVLEDPEKAAVWFRKAADQGVAEAQFQLGRSYDKGLGVQQSVEYAALWYRRAAEKGNPWAQANLGVMQAEGQGMKQDLTMAYVWFNLAASQGIGVALENREILAENMSDEMLEKVREVSREYFHRYVEPFMEAGPNLRRGMPSHKHPAEQAPASHP